MEGLVTGLRVGVPYLRSGLCSSACGRTGGFPSFWRVWLCAFALGSPSQGLVCVGTSHLCSERGLCLWFPCVFLRDVSTLWVECVFSPLLPAFVGFLFCVVFLRPSSDRRNLLWLVAALWSCWSFWYWPVTSLLLASSAATLRVLCRSPGCPVIVHPPLTWQWGSFLSLLSFALWLTLDMQAPEGSLPPYG